MRIALSIIAVVATIIAFVTFSGVVEWLQLSRFLAPVQKSQVTIIPNEPAQPKMTQPQTQAPSDVRRALQDETSVGPSEPREFRSE
ncbi:MAG: hypothetical protein WA418_28060 [Bradyrhizobium sp.]